MNTDKNGSEKPANSSTCVLHPERAGPYEVTGIRVCVECFEVYRNERREFQGLEARRFYQSLLKAAYSL
jgi:hypothetical protein